MSKKKLESTQESHVVTQEIESHAQENTQEVAENTPETTQNLPTNGSEVATGSILTTQKPSVPKVFQHMEGSEIEGVDAAALALIDRASNENVSTGELQVSRLLIAQPLTPQIVNREAGWDVGMIFDNLSQDPVSISGKAPWLLKKGLAAGDLKTLHYIPFVPIFRLPTEYVMWPSKDERASGIKNFHWKTLDQHDKRVLEGLWPPKGHWKSDKKEPPPVTEHLNILGVVLDEEGEAKTPFVVLSFSRTNFKIGGKLVTQCVTQKMNNLTFWGRVYYIFTELKKNEKGSFYILNFAKGEKLKEYCDEKGGDGNVMYKQCYDMALALSHPDTGRNLQESMINAAALTEFDADGAGTSEEEDDSEPAF